VNSLSWLLYAADVVGSIGAVTYLALLIIFAGSVATIAGTIFTVHDAYDGKEKEAARQRATATREKIWWRVLPAAGLLTVLLVALPSQNTFYLIAASEVGEQVATTPEAKEILDALKAKIKFFLKDEAS
jgi:hypothetical protein